MKRSSKPPAPTRIAWGAGERKTATWKPLFREYLEPGREPRLMLAQDLFIRIEPEHWLGRDEQTTAVNLIIPEGTCIPWDTPPKARRAQLVIARFLTIEPRKVMRWFAQLLDADADR